MNIEDYSRPWQDIWPEYTTKTGQMKRNLTQEQKNELFIYRAIQIHGNKYDYSRAVYLTNRDSLEIICPVHGVFEQAAGGHLTRRGCSKCSGNIRLTNEQFIEKARGVHGDLYEYSKVNYVTNTTNVTITCRVHGDFQQTPANHASHGHGCMRCGGRAQGTTASFVEAAKAVHGDTFDYSLVKYTTARALVTIICKEHGEFRQAANGHLDGRGCAACSNNKKRDTEEYIKKAKEVHGDSYDYSRVLYVNAHTKIEIGCPIHGFFLQSPNTHFRGSGCARCVEAKSPDKVYLLHLSDNIYKIGITYDISRRLKELQRGVTKQSLGTISVVALTNKLNNPREVEAMLLDKYGRLPGLGGEKFDGHTELRELTGDEVLEIKEYLEGLTDASI